MEAFRGDTRLWAALWVKHGAPVLVGKLWELEPPTITARLAKFRAAYCNAWSTEERVGILKQYGVPLYDVELST